MPNWGHGRFRTFYIEGLGLRLDEIAFANIAWCATSGNRYPQLMLTECFDRFTRRLIELLSPTHVLLSGSKTHAFTSKVRAAAPKADVIEMLHYAHREGHDKEKIELDRVRASLAN